MRRFFYWHLPLVFALVATALFVSGFYKFVTGDTGEAVDFVSPAARPAAAPTSIVTPIILGDSLARGTGDPAGLGIGGRLDQELRRRGIRAKKTVNIAVNGARTPGMPHLSLVSMDAAAGQWRRRGGNRRNVALIRSGRAC